jgi:hypothetical protein
MVMLFTLLLGFFSTQLWHSGRACAAAGFRCINRANEPIINVRPIDQ